MSWRRDSHNANRRWVGPVERYDLIWEGLIAVGVVAVLVIGLSVLFGSPILRGVSFQSWAKADPKDFASTTLTELAGTSETATYGPPYNNQTGQLQSLGPFSPQAWVGVRMPVNAPEDFVITPLTAASSGNADLQKALAQWKSANAMQQQAWSTAALSSTLTVDGSNVKLTGSRDSGPTSTLLSAMLGLAQGGGLTSQSIDAPGNAYSMNYTKSLLYMADGDYLGLPATLYNLKGPQWGVMGEIGSWPGQPWLWFYTMWYNVPLWSNIGTDILAVATVFPLVLFVFLVPFIPGVRSIPRVLRVYRRIWQPYYQKYGKSTEPISATASKK